MIADLQLNPLADDNFQYVRELLAREAAIIIEKGKEYLVETRLAAVATRHGFGSVNELIKKMRQTPLTLGPLHNDTIEALTTNETLFFRDLNPFDALREHVIPQFIARKPGATFTLWSAASSTGQEAYSVAMMLAEHFPNLPARILGTDLSPAVVNRARAGLFQQIEVNRGLPAKLLVKYFHQANGGWQLSDSIRKRVEFREMNLVKPWPLLPTSDVVMVRNVMIYFDVEVRRRILKQVKSVLAPGGYLVLGGSETTVTIDPTFKPTPVGKATFYQL
jgi:chemotaxis protein methyltransferase CheR